MEITLCGAHNTTVFSLSGHSKIRRHVVARLRCDFETEFQLGSEDQTLNIVLSPHLRQQLEKNN